MTFNVKTLKPELTACAIDPKKDITCIQEHIYTHSEDIKYHDSGKGWTLDTASAWKNSVNATVGGVGILIGPGALTSLNSIERIQPRIIVAIFNGNPRAAIISCYSPTNVSVETELITFYDELLPLVRSIPKHNVLIIGSDRNAQIGKNVNLKSAYTMRQNRNGPHLTDFGIENRLHASIQTFKKGRENYGPRHTQTTLKHR